VKGRNVRYRWILVGLLVLSMALLIVGFWRNLVSRAYVQMGSIELSKGLAAAGITPVLAENHLLLAERYLQRALAWNPSDTDTYVKLGATSLAAGQTERALVYLVHAKDVHPGDRLASLWLGVAYSRAGRDQVAVDLFREAGSYGQLLMLGYQYSWSDNFVDAARVFRAAIAVRPGDPLMYYQLGLMEEAAGNFTEAINAYSTYALLEKKDVAQKYLVEARVAELQERWSDALTCYSKAIDISSISRTTPASTPDERRLAADLRNDPEIHFRMGLDYSQLGRHEDSLRELQEAVRLGSTSKWTYRALADAFFNEGEFQSSLAWYRKVLEIDPKDWWATERVQALAGAR